MELGERMAGKREGKETTEEKSDDIGVSERHMWTISNGRRVGLSERSSPGGIAESVDVDPEKETKRSNRHEGRRPRHDEVEEVGASDVGDGNELQKAEVARSCGCHDKEKRPPRQEH